MFFYLEQEEEEVTEKKKREKERWRIRTLYYSLLSGKMIFISLRAETNFAKRAMVSPTRKNKGCKKAHRLFNHVCCLTQKKLFSKELKREKKYNFEKNFVR